MLKDSFQKITEKHLKKYTHCWKVSVTKHNRILFQLHLLAQTIDEKELGYWVGTPTKSDAFGTKGRSQNFKTKTPTPNEYVLGKSNPAWIENLMGFPENWTLIRE